MDEIKVVPYIPDVLKIFGLEEMKTVFESIISLFPEYTTFSNEDESYYDIVNFLQNAHFKVNDERLNHITIENRKAMVRLIHQRIDRLEDITDPLWGYGSQCDGWKSVLDFIALKI